MVKLKDVTKTYHTSKGPVRALEAVNMHIEAGEFVVVRGPSGSGKTTLLMTIGAMLRPTEGQLRVNGTDVYGMDSRRRAKWRGENIGFVFQEFALINYLTVLENVLVAARTDLSTARRRAMALLEQLALADRATHKPGQLSAGEKQRTAVARAVLNEPRLILADEPTGNLDDENTRIVLEHLQRFSQAGGLVILATHGFEADEYASRLIKLQQGRICSGNE